MPVVSKSLLKFGVGLLSARAGMRLRSRSDGPARQKRVFDRLIPKLSKALVWQGSGVEVGMTYAQFQERVPLRTYEDLAPHVERMKKGDTNILWPGSCQIYSVSSGTTAGRTKYIPVTEAMLDHFKRTGLDSILWYTSRVGNTNAFRGRHLFLGGSSALAPIADSEPFEAYAGDLTGIAALNLPGWVERHIYEPGTEIA